MLVRLLVEEGEALGVERVVRASASSSQNCMSISRHIVVANAVEDALADRGAEITRVPLTPARVWQALAEGARHHAT